MTPVLIISIITNHKKKEKQKMETHAKSVRQLEPWGELAGKVVMVTGASSGIGRDFCSDLSKAGCRIIAAARRIDRLQSLCDEINSNSSNGSTNSSQDLRAVAIELDVSANGSAIEAAVQKAWDAFGRIDGLVNNAGFRGSVRSPLELSEEEWEKIHKTNLRGAWLVTKYVCMHMRAANQGGSVINISSIAGINRGQLPGGIAYASSKEALNSITKVLALELGPYKIRVNSISPGLFKSEITEGLIQKDWLKNIELRTIPLRTHGTSHPALTSVVRYLIHDSSEYVSGNMFIVDAGATLPGVPIFSSL
ncbi:uncharacterized protein LOC107032290 [Solanum pennellii]|uniref:Uncharacterized protein LOC107032290 n=1 Tax=Solanum pennellii TaxID=28526 RepID=A0ABM1HRP9_SOLPN|nr:uncharacterized protein LOC107032290 [Solanum pennellii]